MTYKCRTIADGQELVQKSGQFFDTHKIYHTKAGQDIYNYEFIQENNVDTDIYKTLEKYGTLKPIQIDEQAIANEFATMDLRDIYDYKEKANNMWLNLPLSVRNQFNNDLTNFMQNGQKWINDLILKQQIKEEMAQKQEEVKQDEQK